MARASKPILVCAEKMSDMSEQNTSHRNVIEYQGVRRCGLQGLISELEHLYEMNEVNFHLYIIQEAALKRPFSPTSGVATNTPFSSVISTFLENQ